MDNSENKEETGSGLVKRSASWCLERIGMSLTTWAATLSLIKWQSISMCLVLSWKEGLEAIWIAAWLSQNKRVGEESENPKSFNNC